MRRILRVFLAAALVVTALPATAGSRAASSSEPPIISWQPPASYSMAPASGLTKYAEIGVGPAPFFPITPCRQYDSRNFTALSNNTPRSVTVSGAPCSIPGNIFALAVNITVFTIAGATGNGVFKVDAVSPPVTAWINYPPYESQRGNAGVVATNGAGAIFVQVNQGGGSVHFTVDVFGYYYNGWSGGSSNWTMPAGKVFSIVGNNSGIPVMFALNGATAAASHGFVGRTNSTGAGSAGVWGDATGGTGVLYGVSGTSVSSDAASAGVHGSAGAGIGVIGVSGTTAENLAGVYGTDGIGVNNPSQGYLSSGVLGHGQNGVVGLTSTLLGFAVAGQKLDGSGNGISQGEIGTNVSGVRGEAYGTGVLAGVFGSSTGQNQADGSAGVVGLAVANGSTILYGVQGGTSSIADTSAGVLGRAGTASWTAPLGTTTFGVRGAAAGNGFNVGVMGEGTNEGVDGVRVTASGVVQTRGMLGGPGTAGVYSVNDYAGVGAKYFVEPHPVDATKQIAYIALEGPEAGTYFRGRGRFQGKSAIIVVPDSFRLVTEEESLTVQITPIGRATPVGVLSMDLTQIVVEGESDVEFSYLVQGVRKGYADMKPVQENVYFVPSGPRDRMGPYPERIKQRLVFLGIYHPDGTVNMQTAERMGWAQKWREDERLRQQVQQSQPAISHAPQDSGKAPRQ